MTKLKKSEQTYSLKTTDDKNQTNLKKGKESDEKIVEFSFNDIGGLIHELVHGKQFEEGELGFDVQTGKGVGLDLDDEVEAFGLQGDAAPGSLVDALIDNDKKPNVTKETVGSINSDYGGLSKEKRNKNTIDSNGKKLKDNYYFKKEE